MSKRAMQVLLSLYVLWLLLLTAVRDVLVFQASYPRKFLPFDGAVTDEFSQNKTTLFDMLLREDLGVVIVSANEVIFVLDIKNITKELARTVWKITSLRLHRCQEKRNPQIICTNLIKVLLKFRNGNMWACGTNGFDPRCRSLSFRDGQFVLQEPTNGSGRVPLHSDETFAAITFEQGVVTASFDNMSRPLISHYKNETELHTVPSDSWLKDPMFSSVLHIREPRWRTSGEPDRIFFFFTETDITCNCDEKIRISRVARVCLGDEGALTVLVHEWTSFLKARIDCPVVENKLPFLVQGSFLLCDKKRAWTECFIYATFTAQLNTSDISAVCVYRVFEIDNIFSSGQYKSRENISDKHVWLKHTDRLPTPRPGACLNNELRRLGIYNTAQIPRETLTHLREHPIMYEPIKPAWEKPLLIRRGAFFTQIAVMEVRAGDGKTYTVVFIGTETGTLVKALHLGSEMFFIEEVKIFQFPQSIKVLKISSRLNKIYALSQYGLVEVSPSNCVKYQSCVDCVLARDPFCGWSTQTQKCVRAILTTVIQSLKYGNASLCPSANAVRHVNRTFVVGSYLKLCCQPSSLLANVIWEKDNLSLTPSLHVQFPKNALVIQQTMYQDAGRYYCIAVEQSKVTEHRLVEVEYQVEIISKTKICSLTGFLDCSLFIEEQKAKWKKPMIWVYPLLALFIFVTIVFLAPTAFQYFKNRHQIENEEESSSSESS